MRRTQLIVDIIPQPQGHVSAQVHVKWLGRDRDFYLHRDYPDDLFVDTFEMLWSGSASMPASPSKLVAVVRTCSWSSSASSRMDWLGAAKDLRIDTGKPALLPGV